MTKNSEMVSVPRELLERATRDFTGRPSWDALEDIRLKATEELRALLLAAPAEDVRAVVDEPVGYCAPAALDDLVSSGRNGYLTLLKSRTSIGSEPLYRHPQRPVVLPERVDPEFFDSIRATGIGWNACIDEFERLNK